MRNLAAVLVLAALATTARAEIAEPGKGDPVRVIRRSRGNARIRGLNLGTAQARLAAPGKVALEVAGTFVREGWGLLTDTRAVKIGPKGALNLAFPALGKSTVVHFVAIGPHGEVETENAYVTIDPAEWSRLTGAARVSRISIGAALGPTILRYVEDPIDIRLNQVGMTGKASFGYQLVPDKFDFAANMFMTLFPLTHSPDALATTRFYGINARFGYRIPGSTGRVRWSVLGGWYFWGMIVNSNDYGVSSLNGPQIFVLASIAANRPFSVYLKFAPLSDRPGAISLSHREIAVGGSYPLWREPGAREITLAADLSHAQAANAEVGNSMSLVTASLSLQISLFLK